KKEREVIINENSKRVASFPKSNDYKFDKLLEFEGTPYKIFEVDSGLFVFDLKGWNNKIFHFYDFKSKDFKESFIGKGSGPYETFAPFSSGIKNQVLWVMDKSISKVVSYDLSNVNGGENRYEVKFNDYFNDIDIFNEDEFIGNGLLTSMNKFQRIDKLTGEIIQEFGSFTKISDDIPNELLRDYFQAKIAVKPDEKKLVTAYRWHESIEIFDLADFESILIQGPENIDNDFALTQGENGKFHLERGGDLQHTYTDLAVTDDFIYISFSGEHDKITDSFMANTILVYNWDGEPISKINLDRKIMSFSVSSDSKRIYSFDVDKGEIIYIDL
ncbi:MAG: BF3164 family lipoprotein, partial [Cyclobacteriaceae bacterium]